MDNLVAQAAALQVMGGETGVTWGDILFAALFILVPLVGLSIGCSIAQLILSATRR